MELYAIHVFISKTRIDKSDVNKYPTKDMLIKKKKIIGYNHKITT